MVTFLWLIKHVYYFESPGTLLLTVFLFNQIKNLKINFTSQKTSGLDFIPLQHNSLVSVAHDGMWQTDEHNHAFSAILTKVCFETFVT